MSFTKVRQKYNLPKSPYTPDFLLNNDDNNNSTITSSTSSMPKSPSLTITSTSSATSTSSSNLFTKSKELDKKQIESELFRLVSYL